MRREKYPLSKLPGKFKGIVHEKIEWDILTWLRKNETFFYCLVILSKKFQGAH
jgi:hypothetical protein